MTAVTSIRWLVVRGSPPESDGPPSTAHAHPPGPGLPRHDPSVYATVGEPGSTGVATGTACPSHRDAERTPGGTRRLCAKDRGWEHGIDALRRCRPPAPRRRPRRDRGV